MFLIPNDTWEIKNSEKKGKGIFAKKDIEAGVIIGDYLGKAIRIQDEETYDSGKNFYSMYYSDTTLIIPTPDKIKKPGIHLLNHSCTPNCWMYTLKGHTLFFSLRKIFSGEELTVSYLLSPLDEECKPCTHLCECNGVICFQTMHLSEKRYKDWDKFHEMEEKKTKPEEVEFGEELKKLSSYPKNIEDNPIYPLFGTKISGVQKLTNQVMPPIADLRKIIRENGKAVEFEELHVRVLGILENLIISEPI